jgi:hypothetical protein
MLDETFQERAGRLIAIQLEERRKQVPVEIAGVKSEAAKAGMLNSSRTVLQSKDYVWSDLEVRPAVGSAG